MPPSALHSRLSLFETADGGSLHSMLDDAASGQTKYFDLSAASSSVQHEFVTLSAEKKTEALERLVTAPPQLEEINLSNAGLDNAQASALAAILIRPTLTRFNVERNNLTEAGLLKLAEGLLSITAEVAESSVLTDVTVAHQRTALSTLATSRLLDAMAERTTIVRLGLGQLRDDGARKQHQKVTMANTEAKRLRRVREQQRWASEAEGATTPPLTKRTPSFGSPGGGSGGSGGRRVSGSLVDRVSSIESAMEEIMSTTDWAAEARMITASEPCSSLAGASADHAMTYTMTGNSHWSRGATEEEKRGVVMAFASNTSIECVAFANAAVGDALGALWGEALLSNTSITSLNLESNSISSIGLEAIARALAHGTTQLRELKLANQRVAYSQRSEEVLAEALEYNATLLKLTMDYRSIRARDLANKYLRRNDENHRLSPSRLGPDRLSRRQSESEHDSSPPSPRKPTTRQTPTTPMTPRSPPGSGRMPSADTPALDHTPMLTRARSSRRGTSARPRALSTAAATEDNAMEAITAVVVTSSVAARPRALVCDLTVLGARSIRFRVSHSTLSQPVASMLQGDACAKAADEAHEWLQAGATPPRDVPHADGVAAAFGAAASGEPYLAFVLASALIERLLNELCHGSGGSGGGGVLLKDLISHPTVAARLGSEAVETLTALFSPKALNLRNLVWHGFLRPLELDERYTALVLRMLLRTAHALHDTQSNGDTAPPTYWHPCEADTDLAEALQLLDTTPTLPGPPAGGYCAVCLTSPFCQAGLTRPLRHALEAYRSGDHATFACLAFPILEAGLRDAFTHANPSESPLGSAHLGEYFSTLDGYGQRAKHQLLLHPVLHSTGEPNLLCAHLGRGLHALLLDLALHAAGPGLRAKYAHGEAELAPQTDAPNGMPTASRMLYAALTMLCLRAHTRETLARLQRDAPHDAATRLLPMSDAAAHLSSEYISLCDPLLRLERRRVQVSAAMTEVLADGECYACIVGGGDGDEDSCTITVPANAEHATRTLIVACVIRPGDAAAITRAAALGDRAGAALAAADTRQRAAAPVSDDSTGAASDAAPGVSAEVECSRWGVLSGCARFCELERVRLGDLTDKVVRRVASTSQRRSFVIACHATRPLRRAVALALALAESLPLRAMPAPGDAARDDSADGRRLTPSERAAAAPLLPKLHAFVQALCALYESGKGVDQAIALTEQWLNQAPVRRAVGGLGARGGEC